MAYTVYTGPIGGAGTPNLTASTITVPNGGSSYPSGSAGTVTLTGSTSGTLLSASTSGPYWSNATTAVSQPSPSVYINSDGISMEPETDIKIGDISLKQFMEDINRRLGLMVPNPKLEKDFEQLKELRDRYEALEKECIEKSKVWETLKKE